MERKDAIRERHKGSTDDNGRVLVYNLGSRHTSFFAISLQCVRRVKALLKQSKDVEQKSRHNGTH